MYQLTFEDNSKFVGGLILLDSKWNDMPPKLIREWEYIIFEKQFIFSGYEEYNHIIERVNFSNQEIATKVILMGRIGLLVESYLIDLQERKIYKTRNKLGAEYLGKSTTGWKKGIIGVPLSTISNVNLGVIQ